MKRLYFCFNFCKKNKKQNIAVLENKRFGKGCFKPSEYMLYLNCFPLLNHGGQHYSALTFDFLSRFLNKSGWNVYFWVIVVKNRRGLLDHGTLKSAVSQENEFMK